MKIFLSTGEPSGDLHAANLIRALRRRLPHAHFVGYGGPRMAEAGADVLYPLVDLAVMWFVRVLLNLHVFIRLLRQANRYFRDERPDAVIVIDYPGFNWEIAKRAKAQGVPVFYFVPPQLWAWAGWRVKKMRRYVDYVLCTFPFEADWFRDRGVSNVIEVGHPYFDELADRQLDRPFLADQQQRLSGHRLLTLLPGSRTQEILKNFPMMLRAAGTVARQHSDVRFAVACLNDRHRDLCQQLLVTIPGANGLPLELFVNRTGELIQRADLAWSVSGSVSLELMADAVPTVIVYKVRRFDMFLARVLLQVRYITLVNLLADDEVMPELLTPQDADEELAGWALEWLGDDTQRQQRRDRLAALRDRVAQPGATDRAAEAIAQRLDQAEALSPYAGPHSPARSIPETEALPTDSAFED